MSPGLKYRSDMQTKHADEGWNKDERNIWSFTWNMNATSETESSEGSLGDSGNEKQMINDDHPSSEAEAEVSPAEVSIYRHFHYV